MSWTIWAAVAVTAVQIGNVHRQFSIFKVLISLRRGLSVEKQAFSAEKSKLFAV